MHVEEHLLAASIRDTIREADRAVAKLFYLVEGNTESNVQPGEYHAEQLEAAEITLSFLIEKVFRDVGIMAERLGLPHFRSDVAAKMASFKDLAHIEMTPWDVMMHSPPLAAARVLFSSLAIMTDGREVTGLGVFETILGNTAKIVERSSVPPKNETDVRNRILDILSFAFPDATKEVPLAKILKVYKPDIAVRSLMAAAEYKFADTKEKAKAALGGIYEDMRGYAGDPNWRSFYAVIYMTKTFYTQKDVEREFQLVKADLNWTPIVVYGPSITT
jgi:REase_DpnII-MboI